jgi:hypothetical protein
MEKMCLSCSRLQKTLFPLSICKAIRPSSQDARLVSKKEVGSKGGFFQQRNANFEIFASFVHTKIVISATQFILEGFIRLIKSLFGCETE